MEYTTECKQEINKECQTEYENKCETDIYDLDFTKTEYTLDTLP